MDRTMQIIFGFIASLLGFYSMLIIIRIILTWFSGANFGRPIQILAQITDPYLNWWRQRFRLQAGILDLSPLAAMAALSVVQTIFSAIARQGRLSPAIILIVCLNAFWSVTSFIIGFCIFVLALRLFAYFINANMYSHFWQIVDSISRSILYSINSIIFRKRVVSFFTGIISAIAVLIAAMIIGRFAVMQLIGILSRSIL
jgi:YggT family protein